MFTSKDIKDAGFTPYRTDDWRATYSKPIPAWSKTLYLHVLTNSYNLVILSWNSSPYTAGCVASLRDTKDATPQWLAEQLRLLEARAATDAPAETVFRDIALDEGFEADVQDNLSLEKYDKKLDIPGFSATLSLKITHVKHARKAVIQLNGTEIGGSMLSVRTKPEALRETIKKHEARARAFLKTVRDVTVGITANAVQSGKTYYREGNGNVDAKVSLFVYLSGAAMVLKRWFFVDGKFCGLWQMTYSLRSRRFGMLFNAQDISRLEYAEIAKDATLAEALMREFAKQNGLELLVDRKPKEA